jgi:hypothetical protein
MKDVSWRHKTLITPQKTSHVQESVEGPTLSGTLSYLDTGFSDNHFRTFGNAMRQSYT